MHDIDGLETYGAHYDAEMSAAVTEIAKTRGLLRTGGGDGHGSWADAQKYAIRAVELCALNLGELETRVVRPQAAT